MSNHLRRIGVLMPRADAHTRGIFCGITRYARPLRAWVFHMGLADASIMTDLRRWKPHGIIATLPNEKIENRFVKLGVPVVNCSSNITTPGGNRVITDNAAVGQLAAEHLLARGLKHMAYCGESKMQASDDRARAFLEHVKMPVHQYVDQVVQSHVGEIGWRVSDQNDQLRQWLKNLPKPVGVLACHDPMAMVLVEICRQLDINVPGDVAILGVDDDAMLCEMAYPTLSSVQMAHERIGFEAARRLDQLMADPTLEPTVQRISPMGVVARQSTDAMASDDSVVAAVLRYIHEHADEPIRVSDVVQQVTISRRSLEMRFEAAIGTSILHAIQMAHIDLARELLASTQLSIEQIALACGFNSRERFSAVYLQLAGQTPGRGRGRTITN
ncbi:MAG: substrate-binding domain-containing protein [Phycisphaeraceae bacterium]|nr:substrate-binding domain-containing protein [Phycisphaeraceae bacterium]